MKDEVLNLMKKSYGALKNKQNEDIKRLEKLKQLEQNEIVQEYLKLKSYFGKYGYAYKELTDDDLLETAFMGIVFRRN